jgi:hypothetical protein
MDDGWISGIAHELGSVASGSYRTVVLESGGRVTHHDFASLESAKQFADDAASEDDNDSSPMAYVLDSEFSIVDRGRHYAT